MIAPNTISASVGVVDDRDGTRSPDDLLREADTAMYARKHGMRSTGSMTAMTSRALAHHRLAMDGMHGSFVVLRAIRDDDEIVDFEIVEANAIVRRRRAHVCGQVVGVRHLDAQHVRRQHRVHPALRTGAVDRAGRSARRSPRAPPTAVPGGAT